MYYTDAYEGIQDAIYTALEALDMCETVDDAIGYIKEKLHHGFRMKEAYYTEAYYNSDFNARADYEYYKWYTDALMKLQSDYTFADIHIKNLMADSYYVTDIANVKGYVMAIAEK